MAIIKIFKIIRKYFDLKECVLGVGITALLFFAVFCILSSIILGVFLCAPQAIIPFSIAATIVVLFRPVSEETVEKMEQMADDWARGRK